MPPPIHFLTAGNLVTTKGARWRFAVSPLLARFGPRFEWSYGTPYTSDSTDPPASPTQWLPAGVGAVSQPIHFPISAPFQVRVRLLSGRTDKRERRWTEVREPPPAAWEAIIVVYPGAVKVDDAPLYLAQATQGFLPVMFTITGMGPQVFLEDNVEYGIRVPRVGATLGRTARFSRNDSGDIDTPRLAKENGQGATYNVYMAPDTLRRIGHAGRTAGVQGNIRLDLKCLARPTSENPAKRVELRTRYDGVNYYVDERPELVHFELAGSGTEYTFPMSGSSERVGAARAHLQVYQPGFWTVPFPHWAYGSTPLAYRGADELVLYRDASPASGELVALDVELKDTAGITYDNYANARVEGARRAAPVFQYYKRKTRATPAPLTGLPLCIVGRDLAGRIVINLHRDDPNARIWISGLDNPAKLFDYAGLATAALTMAAGVAGIINAPIAAAALTIGSGIASIWWSYMPAAPAYPYTSGQCHITSTVAIHDVNGTPRTSGAADVKNTSHDANTGGWINLDARYSYVGASVVGDLVRVAQDYAVQTLQQEDETLHTAVSIRKRNFASALIVEANS